MAYIKETGITKLIDLLDIEKLRQLGKILLENFDELLMYDKSIDLTKIPNKEKFILIEGQNPQY